MLVPLTDPENPFAAMMLELIEDTKPYPQSRLPRPVAERPSKTRARGPIAVPTDREMDTDVVRR